MSHRHQQIVILGGGPAGAAAALGLARLGHSPLLIAAPRRPAAIEGFSDRTLQALETLGFSKALARIGPRVERQAWWGGRLSQVNSEHIVERHDFDPALIADVANHGIEVLRGRVGRITRSDGAWHVAFPPSQRLTADVLIEARGRAAPIPSRARRNGPATVSLARAWTGLSEAPDTAVATMAEGWAWYAGTGGGRAVLQLLVAAEPGALPKRQDLAAFYDRILAESDTARGWVAGGQPCGDVAVRRAGPQCALRPLDDAMIRIGDAAVAPDPLSGHGVFVALGGAQAAAIAVNTLLRRPAAAALATAFYEERCRLDFMRLARIGRGFYEQEQRWPAHPFWRARHLWPDAEPPHPPLDSHPPRIERRPVVDHGFVTEQEVVVTPDHPRGVWVIDGVPLVPLYRAIGDGAGSRDIGALAERLGKPAPSVDLAAQWLRARFGL